MSDLGRLAADYFDKGYEHVRIVRALGLWTKDAIDHYVQVGDEPRQYFHESIASVMRWTVNAGYSLLREMRPVLVDNAYPSTHLDEYLALVDAQQKPPATYWEMIALDGNLCSVCAAREPYTWPTFDPAHGDADMLLRVWLHGQRMQQYMTFLQRTLVASGWQDQPGFTETYASVTRTVGLFAQQADCMAVPFNCFSVYIRRDDPPLDIHQWAPRVSLPALNLASNYVIAPDTLCGPCTANLTPEPPNPLW